MIEHFLQAWKGSANAFEGHLYHLESREAIQHLFRVASSLDSMVVGEPQILGQVKEAFAVARASGTIASQLEHLLQSAFAAVRLWGGPVALAYAAQVTIVLAVAFFLVRIWRSESALAFKAAALIAGAILATPYALDYDLVVMGPALAFLAAYGLKRGFLP